VAWYPWGDEAFEDARSRDKPVFLSIGYATCHWCHVMAHESFEDPSVAALLNESFISVKLDREERPDIDALYMTVCQLMTGHGGWPLTIAMTPDRRPFFAGTYIPRETRAGRIGMLELVPRLHSLWVDRRSDLEASADAAIAAVREIEARARASDPADRADASTLARGYRDLRSRYDPHQGGFGRAPKFPTPHQLLFLLRWHDRTGDPIPREMVEKTLSHMRRGGIFDQVGFGFHRYSTDSRWLLPHFEKMLYDQALLVLAYVETWQVSGDVRYRRVAEEVLDYVLRTLTHEDGAFFSAEDADSDGREGAFYVWPRADFDRVLTDALGGAEAAFAREVFGVEERGNFADEATGQFTGENVLHRRRSIAQIAAAAGVGDDEVRDRLARIRRTLLASRAHRPRPLLDDKILTDWNGLMIAAFAVAGYRFAEPSYVRAARRAADFVLAHLRVEGRLQHRYREGEAALNAGATDFAYMVWGMVELYGATLEVRWLEEASRLAGEVIDGFWDDENGGVFNSAADVDDVAVRQREIHDGATPSANATLWYALGRLAQLTGDSRWLEHARRIGDGFGRAVTTNPSAHPMSLVALDLELGPSREVVIAGSRRAADTTELLEILRQGYRPRTAVLLRPDDAAEIARLDMLAPFASSHVRQERASAYVCERFACQRPTTDAVELLRLISRVEDAPLEAPRYDPE